MSPELGELEELYQEVILDHSRRPRNFGELPGMRVLGPSGERGAIVGFVMDAAHPHDLTTFADQYGLALRGGHHCNQPLMRRLGVESTARASFYFYNTTQEIDRFVEVIEEIQKFFGA